MNYTGYEHVTSTLILNRGKKCRQGCHQNGIEKEKNGKKIN